MIKLSARLKKIADTVLEEKEIIDLGCDHGLVSIYLCQLHDDIHIIASDINEKALNNAKENIKKYNLEARINPILSNGLNNIDPLPNSLLMISGLGAYTIIDILTNNLSKLTNINSIVIQSNNRVKILRKNMIKLNYFIKEEYIIKDKGKYYIIIKFMKGKRKYNNRQLEYGPLLLKSKDIIFKEYLQNELEKNKKIYLLLPKGRLFTKLITYFKIKKLMGLLRDR